MLGFVPRLFGSRGIYSDQKIDTFFGWNCACLHNLFSYVKNIRNSGNGAFDVQFIWVDLFIQMIQLSQTPLGLCQIVVMRFNVESFIIYMSQD